MNILIVGTCPWIKNPFGYITNKIAYTASELGTVLLLAEGHDASVFGDGIKSSIKNEGRNEIEIWNLPSDPGKAAVFLEEINKAWKVDILLTIGHLAKYEWIRAHYEFSNSSSKWIALLPENVESVFDEEHVDYIISLNKDFQSDVGYEIIDPKSIWHGVLNTSNICNSNHNSIGILGENTILSNFHVCKNLKEKYHFKYFNNTNPRAYFSDAQLNEMGIEIYEGFRTINFWDDDTNLVNFINNNDFFIILDDVPDFGYYAYACSLANKCILSSDDRLKFYDGQRYASTIKIPSNQKYIKNYNIFKDYEEINTIIEKSLNFIDTFYIKEGVYTNSVEVIKMIITKINSSNKRNIKVKLELIS